jgi:hypothetical protein
MLTHVVLFRPRPELDPPALDALIRAIEEAAREIPEVRRFTVGRQVANPPAYLAGGFPPFPYAAIVELDDRAALDAYLAHPAHAALGRAFNATLAATLIYDFDSQDAGAGLDRAALAPPPSPASSPGHAGT